MSENGQKKDDPLAAFGEILQALAKDLPVSSEGILTKLAKDMPQNAEEMEKHLKKKQRKMAAMMVAGVVVCLFAVVGFVSTIMWLIDMF